MLQVKYCTQLLVINLRADNGKSIFRTTIFAWWAVNSLLSVVVYRNQSQKQLFLIGFGEYFSKEN